MTEHEEARRLADRLWDVHEQNDMIVRRQASRLLREQEERIAKAEQERDDLERELERLREACHAEDHDPILDGVPCEEGCAICASLSADTQRERLDPCPNAHVFPPNAVTGDPCYCGKAAW